MALCVVLEAEPELLLTPETDLEPLNYYYGAGPSSLADIYRVQDVHLPSQLTVAEIRVFS